MCGGHALEWGWSLRRFDLLETRGCTVLCFNQSILMVTNCRTQQLVLERKNSMNTKQRVTQDHQCLSSSVTFWLSHTIKEYAWLEGRESSPKNIYKSCMFFSFSRPFQAIHNSSVWGKQHVRVTLTMVWEKAKTEVEQIPFTRSTNKVRYYLYCTHNYKYSSA